MKRSERRTATGSGGEPVDDARTRLPARLRLALVLSAATQLIMAFTSTATNIAFPDIEESFSTPRTTLAWSITGFAIVQAALLLVCGRLADRLGRKSVFEYGLAAFSVASLGAALAPTGGIFIGARLLQGVGAAIVVPTALALVLHEFPASRRIWVATTSAAIFSVGQAASPTVAAALTQAVSWRLVYLWPAAMCAAIGIAGHSVFRESRASDTGGRIDVLGAVLGAMAVAGIVNAFAAGPSDGWTSPQVLVGLVAGAVLVPLVVHRSARHPDPLFEPALVRIRSVWSSCSTTVITSAVGMGIWVAWPLLLTQTLGYTTLETGILLTPVPVVMAVAAIAGGRVIDHVGPRAVVVAGVLCWIVGLALLIVSIGDDPRYLTDLLPGFLVCGAGYGLTMGPLQGLALRDVPDEAFGQVNAIVLTIRFVGGALGVAISIGIIGNADPPPISGFGDVHGAFLAASVVALALTLFLPARGRGAVRTSDEAELAAEIEAREGI